MDQGPAQEGIALTVPGVPERREAEALVRQALRRDGIPPWREMEIELYKGAAESLLIARPRRRERVYIALPALELLWEKFGS